MFNLHAAVWSQPPQVCVAVYNVQYVSRRTTNRRCVYSQCAPDDGEVHRRFRESIHEVAREVKRQLEEVSRMAGIAAQFLWDVIVALVTFIFAVLMLPFGGAGQYA